LPFDFFAQEVPIYGEHHRMSIQFVKHNPAFLDAGHFLEQVVARRADVAHLLGHLGSCEPIGTVRHLFITGQRGSGKTFVVRRVALAVEQHNALRSRYYPLFFSEESYSVSSSAEFWLEALFHLARQTANEQFAQTYQALREEVDEERIRQIVLPLLLDFADNQGKTLLLIIENFSMLLADMASSREGEVLAQTLLQEPRFQLLATGTFTFDSLEVPFGKYFSSITHHALEPLSNADCNALWQLYSGTPLADGQIRAMNILAGGNARLLVTLARVANGRTFSQLPEILALALDEHTEYCKSYLDVMAPVERKVYLSIAELWAMVSAREVSLAARIDINKTSAYLNRLINRGAISVERQAKRNKLYGVTERIYSIYYLMRRHGWQSGRVRALLDCMLAFYDPASFPDRLSDSERERCISVAEALTMLPEREHVEQCHQNFLDAKRHSRFVPSLASFVRFVQKSDVANADESASPMLGESFHQAFELLEAESYAEALPIFDAIIMVSRHSESEQAIGQRYGAMIGRGVALGNLERYEEGFRLLDEVAATCQERSLRRRLKWGLLALLGKASVLNRAGRIDDAVTLYDELVSRYRRQQELECSTLVAAALLHKSLLVSKSKGGEEEIAMCDTLLELYSERVELPLVELVCAAWRNKAIAFEALNRNDDALLAYGKLLALCRQRSEPHMMQHTAHALQNMGVVYGKMHRYSDAEHCFMEVQSLAPQQARAHLMLLKLLVKMEEQQHAVLSELLNYLAATSLALRALPQTIELFITCAVAGYAAEALELLVASPLAVSLEPVQAALQEATGDEVRSAPTIVEVANDIVAAIEARRNA
jgi:tetratricopeptide (TPR) repeat protein